jgi:hypothetical protein
MRKKEKARNVKSTYKVDQAKARHAFNREVNAEAAKANAQFVRGLTAEGADPTFLLTPEPRYQIVKGERMEPYTNKGNGRPTRNSQLRRAFVRVS